MSILTVFIALIGVCYLALATFLTYKHTVKVSRKEGGVRRLSGQGKGQVGT